MALAIEPDRHSTHQEAAEPQNVVHRPDSDARPFEYRPSIVSYFDILGMKKLLTEAGTDAGKVARVLQIARRCSKPDSDLAEIFESAFVNFSDLILRAVPILGAANLKHRLGIVFHELFDLGHIQVNLLFNNVLIRGAVTLGSITVDRELVFGPALATAHLLESERATFPRVLIDPVVLDGLSSDPILRAHDYDNEMTYIRRLVRKDMDGVWFLDYLQWASDNADDNCQYAEFLLHHRSVVVSQIKESALLDGRSREGRSRRAKAAWLRGYHNRHVRTLSAGLLKEETGLRKARLFI